MICDNTDHKGKKPYLTYPVTMKREFEGGVFDWCDDCIARDWDMLTIPSRKRTMERWEIEDSNKEDGCLHNFQDNICKTCGVVAETDTDGRRVAEDY